MKINVDIDCTPEEARRFMGLPDLAPVHAIFIDQMTRAMSEGMTPDMFDAMVRNWGPLGEASMGAWRQLLGQLAGTTTKS